MNSKSKTLHESLKVQTLELHKKAYQIPYVENFMHNKLQIESYVGHLRAFAIIYGTLEYQMVNYRGPELKQFLHGYVPKLPSLLSDLGYFNSLGIKDILPSVNQALVVADKIMMNGENAYKLLGYIYTLEGSINGGSVLKKHVSAALNLNDGIGTNYLSHLNEEFRNFWQNFISNLNSEVEEKEQQDDVISAANEIFNDVMEIYKALFPIDEKMLGNHITALNPEAGNFPIPTDPRQIKAAITAGIACWNAFPYFEKRFGERGKRFGISDAVWLVTLCELSDENAVKQVNWLARFLAIRGMPTYLEEIQLRLLYTELSKLIPENAGKYSTFLKAADELQNQRTIHLQETDFEKCNSIFEGNLKENAALEKIHSDLKKNMGKLIASSLTDAKNGIPDARTSLENWLKNKEYFPETWVLVVEKSYLEIEKLIHVKTPEL